MANDKQDKQADEPQPEAQPEQSDAPVTFIVNGVEVDANGEPIEEQK